MRTSACRGSTYFFFTAQRAWCAQVESSDSDAWTALMAASLNGQTEAVMFLLKAGARVGAQDKDGWSALSFAAQEGHLTIVRLLLEGGAPVNSVTDDGWTTLHFASREGHVDVLSALAAAGGPLGAATEGGSAAASLTRMACSQAATQTRSNAFDEPTRLSTRLASCCAHSSGLDPLLTSRGQRAGHL